MGRRGRTSSGSSSTPSFDGAELRFSTPEAFFACARERAGELPVVETELQHTFPGCYSVMQDVKRRQRRGELALAGAERAVEQLVEDGSERALALERLDAAWEDLLFCQFHDVLAGTSIPSSLEAVRDLQGRAAVGAEELLVEVSRRWAARHVPPAPFAQLVAVNADETAWSGLVEAEPSLDFEPWGERWLSDPAGRRLPCQLVQPEAQALTTRVVFPLELAPGEVARVLVRDDPPPPAQTAPSALEVSAHALRNERLEAELDGGGVRALRLDGRELLGEGGIGLHLRHDASDTWTHDLDHFPEPVAARLEGAGWEVEEAGPLRARVRLEAGLGASRVRWTLTLEAGATRLGLALDVLWAERLMLLQMPIALPAAPASWTSGLAGGAVTRPPSPAEWPVCGWSSAGELALVTLDASSVSLVRKLLAVDAAAQPQGGLGRWAAGPVRGPRRVHRPGRSRVRLRAARRPAACAGRARRVRASRGGAATAARALRGHGAPRSGKLAHPVRSHLPAEGAARVTPEHRAAAGVARRAHRRARRLGRARVGGARRLALRRRAAARSARPGRPATACGASRIPRCALPPAGRTGRRAWSSTSAARGCSRCTAPAARGPRWGSTWSTGRSRSARSRSRSRSRSARGSGSARPTPTPGWRSPASRGSTSSSSA